MRNLRTATALAGLLACMAGNAYADNSTIENAIRSRPDLSEFYQALVNTGVIHELHEGVSYTVFAPTNAAFAKISPDRYPCFYSSECKEAVAEIVRHHIIPGEVYVDSLVHHQGGVYSIDNRFVAIAEPYRHDYSVDGHNILSEMMLGGSILYRIDGVIANDYDLAKVESPEYIPVAEQQTTTTRTEKEVVDKVCPNGEECPDEISTIVTRTTTIDAPSSPPATLAPAR